ncbi:twin-arginine translocation pathway signal protein [Flavobacterium akiainvivens]|uniref:Twin-arginine translocation pathway signal protein n=1 Tax=Flavobacterium akiainvivens TaxID=1202724 RepID=A0A0M9VK00_9FLAO|nr:twin-arginine translocation pathway signal protein [Flavobacterium akiainvivens]
MATPFFQFCKQEAARLIVKLTGTNHILGHRLWAKDFPNPSKTVTTPLLIVGAGISGLSAARQLRKKGINDFLIIEMENHAGGNAANGENKYSKFPLGAHYLPLPNAHDTELMRFLEEEKIITGYKDGKPIFDENQLTFAPQERLYYKNNWQEGLVPRYGNSKALDDAFNRFFEAMDAFRKEKAADGLYYFDIPISATTPDGKYRNLDTITMMQWLHDNNFNYPELIEYVNYCCRDDYGLGVNGVSAWAGIHYFAGRKHGADLDSVLTWPEGNARLANHLKKYASDNMALNYLAHTVTPTDSGLEVLAFDATTQQTVQINADKVIMATPQFVNGYLLPNRKKTAKNSIYAPWLLATLTLSTKPDEPGFPLCWDNVLHNAKGLGYIYDQHQSIQQLHDKTVITYYYSFAGNDTKKSRKELYSKTAEYWKEFVLADLEAAHPGIKNITEEIQLHRLGHGMVAPVPGYIFGMQKQAAGKPIANRIYFAHTDLAGISIFEEAFHQGINAVNQLLHDTTVDS